MYVPLFLICKCSIELTCWLIILCIDAAQEAETVTKKERPKEKNVRYEFNTLILLN